MTNIAQMISKLERQANHDGRVSQRMSYVLPILVRGGAFLALLFFALVRAFHINGGSLIMPISFTISYIVGVLVAVVAWQPSLVRWRVLGVIAGCLAMVIIVVFAWR